MRKVVTLSFIPTLVLVAAACQDPGGGDASLPAVAKPSARAVSGAPPVKRGNGLDLPEVPAYSAYLAAPARDATARDRSSAAAAAVASVQARLSRRAPGVVAALDARRPVPAFLFAARGAGARALRGRAVGPEQAALAYIDQYRAAYQLGAPALATAEVAGVHAVARGGHVVSLRQRVDGREVFGVRMSVLVDRDLDLVAISGAIHPSIGASWAAGIDSRAALARALADVAGAAPSASASTFGLALASEEEGTARFTSAAGAPFHLPQPARVREVFYALPGALVPAFEVSVEAARAGSTSSRAYEYVIAADDGRILERQNRTYAEARTYRVFADGAEAGFRPTDGPQGDLTPNPTGDVDTPVEVVGTDTRVLAELEGLNTNPDGAADAWLPDGATDLTQGTNVAAYADRVDPDGLSEGDTLAVQNGQGQFAYGYNFATDPLVGNPQIRSSIAQMFFVTNWLHDWWYDSGFTEAAGNAQVDNHDRGGEAADPLLAEAQDTGGVERNNANMSTLPDGLSPRMQMYIFDGPITPIGENSFEVTAPPELAGPYPVAGAEFGVDDLVSASGDLVLVDDGAAPDGGTLTDGCEAFTGVTGAVAVVTRGLCTFELKAQNAVAAGAAAIVIVNSDAEGPDVLPPLGGDDRTIAIPIVGISNATGAALIEALGQGAVSVDLTRAGRDRDFDRDGGIDSAVVGHEWGHYLHHRLTLCETAQCGAMSEGWGDFVALHMLLRDGDDLHGTFSEAAWATDDAYFGIRREPYSVERDKNALTFGDIADNAVLPTDAPMLVFGPNSEIHNAGEVWATTMFEALVALVEDEPGLPFEEARRRMSDYVVTGMLMAPPQPTFTQQRDAILAGIAATGDQRDLLAVANAFARRGFGTGAVSPALESVDFNDVQENFDVSGELVVVSSEVVMDDECDADAHLDVGESGHLVVTVMNGGPIALAGSTVSAAEPPDGLSFPGGGSAEIADLQPYQSAEVEIPLSLDGPVSGIQSLTVTVRAANGASFHTTVDAPLVQRVNFDDVPASAKTDDVESEMTVWQPSTDLGEEAGWARVVAGDNAVWHADDAGAPGEQVLDSPPLTVGAEPFSVSFDHTYAFEASEDETGNLLYFDGGVIEVSIDDGTTWEDASVYADPGYGGELFADSGNPLGGRQAFVAQNVGFPESSHAQIDFGTALAGKTVLLRFRLGTDAASGAPGWDIDNIAFAGIDNTPFTSLVEDATSCGDEGDDGGTGGDGDGGGDEDGCGCRSSGGGAPLSALLFVAALLPVLRRRRRSP
ncbi:MAG TPA: M36 family metallopeptidase [Kofleriaceae bacterium]|nr:M36 family metallopeptidase [Kofleriaceae bacterium]